MPLIRLQSLWKRQLNISTAVRTCVSVLRLHSGCNCGSAVEVASSEPVMCLRTLVTISLHSPAGNKLSLCLIYLSPKWCSSCASMPWPIDTEDFQQLRFRPWDYWLVSFTKISKSREENTCLCVSLFNFPHCETLTGDWMQNFLPLCLLLQVLHRR